MPAKTMVAEGRTRPVCVRCGAPRLIPGFVGLSRWRNSKWTCGRCAKKEGA